MIPNSNKLYAIILERIKWLENEGKRPFQVARRFHKSVPKIFAFIVCAGARDARNETFTGWKMFGAKQVISTKTIIWYNIYFKKYQKTQKNLNCCWG